MPRILDYQENANPGNDAEIVIAQDAQSYKTTLQNTKNIPSRSVGMSRVQEFLNGGFVYHPFDYGVTSMTLSQLASVANHPGILRATSAGLNTKLFLNGNQLTLIQGGEIYEIIFRFTNLATTSGGFYVDVSDNLHIAITSLGVLNGKSANGGSVTTTSTDYTITANTWYRAMIKVSSDASYATFYLYNCATGALLWSDTVSANIPLGIIDETTRVTWGVASSVAVIDIDYLAYYSAKSLQR